MNTPKDDPARARLWVALGNQPGVSAWFSVWSLSREARQQPAATRKTASPETDTCHNQAKSSLA